MAGNQSGAAARDPGRSAMAAVQEHAGEAAALLKALANEQRLLVLCCLLGGSKTVGEINKQVPLSQSALSQHLGVLRDTDLVTTRRASQTIHYTLKPGPALDIMQVLYDSLCAPGAPKPPRAVGRAGRAGTRGRR